MNSRIKSLSVLFSLFLVFPHVSLVYAEDPTGFFYLVRYEGYTWNPCSYNSALGYGTCLSINCGSADGLCGAPSETTVCTDMACVKKAITARGKKHLTGVYRAEFSYVPPVSVEVKKLQVVESFEVVEELQP